MKNHWTQVQPSWKRSPMAFGGHIEQDGNPWYLAETFDPPTTQPVVGGYTIYFVEVDEFVCEFSSVEQLQRMIEMLSQKVLPTTLRLAHDLLGQLTELRMVPQKVLPTTQRLARERGGGASTGPAKRWLSRLPGNVKTVAQSTESHEILG